MTVPNMKELTFNSVKYKKVQRIHSVLIFMNGVTGGDPRRRNKSLLVSGWK